MTVKIARSSRVKRELDRQFTRKEKENDIISWNGVEICGGNLAISHLKNLDNIILSNI